MCVGKTTGSKPEHKDMSKMIKIFPGDFPFTMQEFRDYLDTLPLGSTVGLANNQCDCPIAEFTKNLIDNPEVYVEANMNRVYTTVRGSTAAVGQHFVTPVWASAFILEVDSVASSYEDGERPVKVEEARCVMDKVARPFA